MPTILTMVGIFIYFPFCHRQISLNPITELCKPKTLKIAIISAIRRLIIGDLGVAGGLGIGVGIKGLNVGVGGLGVGVGVDGLGVISVSFLIGVTASVSSGVQVDV